MYVINAKIIKKEWNIDMTNRDFYINIGANVRYSTFNNNFYTIGNIEIGEASGSLINRDVTNEIFANEVLGHFYTFMQVALKAKDKKGLFDKNEIKK
ncbi:hypothetical protein [Leptotrichia sp. oral taxon 847]|uniref:hypothetical protein n=1 Tax=Leptotrichia sp. oral taxon 847 TaxID=1785996 RepID=UPI0007684BC3|nr:hypothetical protein [Leptotrichia sp. oral taxon 847]AMD94195.1 hypothetical protein AXF11_00370 [Leptotrichia sp. oral taxon 847]